MAKKGTQQTGDPAGGTGNDQDKNGKPAAGDKTFTQEELNQIVTDRLTRQSKKLQGDHAAAIAKAQADHEALIAEQYPDYDALKTAAAKLKEIEDADKTDVQRLTERLETIEAKRAAEAKQASDQLAAQTKKASKDLADVQAKMTALEQQRVDMLLRTSIVAEATRQGYFDPDDAYGLLDLSKLVVEDDKVEGLEEALKELAKAKPYLLQAKPRLGATHPGRASQIAGEETDEERRTRLFGAGGSPIGEHGGGVFMPKLEE